jgi:hypothetical protein
MKTLTNGKRKWKTILGIACLSSLGLNAQNVGYKVLEDNPNIKNLFIGLNPFDAVSYNPNTGLSWNVYANAFIGSRFQVDIDFKKAYTDDNADGVFSPEGLKKMGQFRLGGELNLSNGTKTRKTRVVLSSSTSGNYTHTRYIMVPATRKTIFAIRGGLQSFYNNCQVDNDILKIRGENDIQYKDANGDLKFVFDNKNYETVNYTMRTSGFYAGIDLKKLTYLKIKPEGYKEKGSNFRHNFYFDALITPIVKYELKPNSSQSQFDGIDINISENKRSYFGWRFGWQYDMGKWAGLSCKAEVGQQPGRPDEKFFISIGMGLHIGGHLKNL